MKVFKSHPEFPAVLKVYQRLEAAGFQTLLAGGCVRDGILGRKPNDFDIACNAKPEQVIELFPKTVQVGKAFGVIVVVEDGVEVEVTSFRSDGLYEDGRHPTVVEYSTPEEDAKRRDFTINALFYDLSKDQILDFVGGQKDIQNRVIKAVGNAGQRFREDHLRLLRAVRFVGQLGFELEPFTRQAIIENVKDANRVSHERIHQEIKKLIQSENAIQAMKEFVNLGFSQVLFEGHELPMKPWIDEGFAQAQGELGEAEFLLFRWFLLINAIFSRDLAGFSHRTPEHSMQLTKKMEQWLSQWRFSNFDKQQIQKMLAWRISSQTWSQKSAGEIAEQYFDLYHRLALNFYSDHKLVDSQLQESASKIFNQWGGKKPEAIIKAKDLASKIHGAELGQALKISYWAQLEGKITDLNSGLQLLKAQSLI